MEEVTTRDVSCPFDLPEAEVGTSVAPVLEKYETALLMLVGFAGFSIVIALMYNRLRKYVFQDVYNLDTVFDAGGKVSFSLTAVTAMSQCLWPADFLQSPTIASKVGIAGTLWYTIGVLIALLIFPVMCTQVKTRAPGAKTYPQILYARFGKPTHIMFCLVALGTSTVITSNIIMAGKAALDSLSKDTTNEFVLLILAVLFGSYCLIGGLGTTFYISYFNTSIIFITASVFVLKFSFIAEPEVEEITRIESLYEAMSCIKGPDGNYNNSLLTFRSEGGLIFGLILLLMTIGIFFCDQATWQSRIAAKPREGMIGFMIAGILWFAIPTSFSFVSAMTYNVLSYRNGTSVLTADDIDAGYITPLVVKTLMGREGVYLLFTLMTMAMMSTGSGEVMAVSSVIVYDIYKTYVNPFRDGLQPTFCPLCAQPKIKSEDSNDNICSCPTSLDCEDCSKDVQLRLVTKKKHNVEYKCSIHGKYRRYEDMLLEYKSWCMVWVIISIIPLGMVLIESGVNLNWTFLAAQVFIVPFIVPLYLAVAWSKATGPGIFTGGLLGLISSVVGLLAVGSTYPGGLSDFFVNTTQDYSLLAGLGTGIVVSSISSVLVSLCTNNITCAADVEMEWQKTLSIDNPLNPYRGLYQQELDAVSAGNKVTYQDMLDIFRSTRIFSYVVAAVVLVLFIVVIPAIALGMDVLTLGQLSTWVSVCQYWCLIGTVLVVVVPPVEEVLSICREYRKTRKKSVRNNENRYNGTDSMYNLSLPTQTNENPNYDIIVK